MAEASTVKHQQEMTRIILPALLILAAAPTLSVVRTGLPTARASEPCLQSSVMTATDTGWATFRVDEGVASIAVLEAVSADDFPSSPEDPRLSFPHGFFYLLLEVNTQDLVTVTITLPSPMPRGCQYWKSAGPSWGWKDATQRLGDDDGDVVLTLSLQDGDEFDADESVNSIIVDPGGPGVILPEVTTTARTTGAVGGILMPENRFLALAPCVAVIGMAAIAVTVLAARRRRRD